MDNLNEIYNLFEEKELNEWKINKFSVKNDFNTFRFAMQGRPVPEGNYIRLQRNNKTIMSNTPAEIKDFNYFVYEATGKILVAGLGLGCVLYALAKKENVTKVIVIEKDKNVIDLIWDKYKEIFKDKIEIVNQDIFEYQTNEKFDFGWFDIWDDICADNYEEMKTLKRKFLKKIKYKKCWCEYEVKRNLKNNY